jgi:hypothetical protein
MRTLLCAQILAISACAQLKEDTPTVHRKSSPYAMCHNCGDQPTPKTINPFAEALRPSPEEVQRTDLEQAVLLSEDTDVDPIRPSQLREPVAPPPPPVIETAIETNTQPPRYRIELNNKSQISEPPHEVIDGLRASSGPIIVRGMSSTSNADRLANAKNNALMVKSMLLKSGIDASRIALRYCLDCDTTFTGAEVTFSTETSLIKAAKAASPLDQPLPRPEAPP